MLTVTRSDTDILSDQVVSSTGLVYNRLDFKLVSLRTWHRLFSAALNINFGPPGTWQLWGFALLVPLQSKVFTGLLSMAFTSSKGKRHWSFRPPLGRAFIPSPQGGRHRNL